MDDWLVKSLNERERLMYRIAMTNAKDPQNVDDIFHANFAIQPERSKREDTINAYQKLNSKIFSNGEIKDEYLEVMRCSEHSGN